MARLEKRREWQAKATAESARRWSAATSATAGIPLGQPILVGHHSERKHRRALERAQSNATKACEAMDRARDHGSKAGNIADALDRTIFSDDSDAIEALEARLASLEAQREERRKLGAAWRKAKKPHSADAAGWEKVCAIMGWTLDSIECKRAQSDCRSEEGYCNRGPVPSYVLSNLGGNISRIRKRVDDVKAQNAARARCKAAGGLLIERFPSGYCRVRFEDYPGRATVDSLKASGFHWGGGAWSGKSEAIPANVLAQESQRSACSTCGGTLDNIDYTLCEACFDAGQRAGGGLSDGTTVENSPRQA